jgi:hypothetical protein
MRAAPLEGKIFGNLVVVRRVPAHEAETVHLRVTNLAWWICKCVCGVECLRSGRSLTSGSAKHCGCMRRSKSASASVLMPSDAEPSIDLAEQRFGLLTAIAPVGRSSQGWFWRLRCECGREHVARAKDLRAGNTASCGCLKAGRGVPNGQPAIAMKRPWRLEPDAPPKKKYHLRTVLPAVHDRNSNAAPSVATLPHPCVIWARQAGYSGWAAAVADLKRRRLVVAAPGPTQGLSTDMSVFLAAVRAAALHTLRDHDGRVWVGLKACFPTDILDQQKDPKASATDSKTAERLPRLRFVGVNAASRRSP